MQSQLDLQDFLPGFTSPLDRLLSSRPQVRVLAGTFWGRSGCRLIEDSPSVQGKRGDSSAVPGVRRPTGIQKPISVGLGTLVDLRAVGSRRVGSA